MTLGTLNYGNYGIFLIGFCPSTVPVVGLESGQGAEANVECKAVVAKASESLPQRLRSLRNPYSLNALNPKPPKTRKPYSPGP